MKALQQQTELDQKSLTEIIQVRLVAWCIAGITADLSSTSQKQRLLCTTLVKAYTSGCWCAGQLPLATAVIACIHMCLLLPLLRHLDPFVGGSKPSIGTDFVVLPAAAAVHCDVM